MSYQQKKEQESVEMLRRRTVSDAQQEPEVGVQHESVKCPQCGYSFITGANGKRKLRTRLLIFAGNGNTMGICPQCKTNLKVPVMLTGEEPDE